VGCGVNNLTSKSGNSTTLAQSQISHKKEKPNTSFVSCMVMGSGSVTANDSVEKADIALLLM
jgi:hypothetical protein